MNASAQGVALQVRDLDVDLGGRPVLRGVNLDLYRGELAGVLGPNGAGKTTMLRSILGLVRPRDGSIVIGDGLAGDAVGGSAAGQGAQRPSPKTIGYVPQRHEFAWDMPLTVRDAVENALACRAGLFGRVGLRGQQAIERALARTHMSDLASRPVGELSGGQRQRVLVARALAIDPEVLLLDEPMTGLDMPTQEMLTSLFRDLANEGHALLMTTHDLVTAVAVMDRIHLVRGGVIASGRPGELSDPEPWTRTFDVSTSNPLLAALGLDCDNPKAPHAHPHRLYS